MISPPTLLALLSWALVPIYPLYRAFRGEASIGMFLSYVTCLAVIHLFGGLLLFLPWYQMPLDVALQTTRGFELTGLGLLGLAAGHFAFGWIRPEGRPAAVERISEHPNGWILIGIGSICYFVLGDLLSAISTVSAIIRSGMGVAVAGFCLIWWRSIQRGEPFVSRAKHLWLLVLLPAATLVLNGFLSFAISPVTSIVMFILVVEPRRKLILSALPFLAVAALSVFTSYLTVRERIRESVWGGDSLQQRMEVVAQEMGKKTGVFNIYDPQDLRAINSRLNQNLIVGQCEEFMALGHAQSARGGTLVTGLIGLIPRVLWPDKPIVAGGSQLVTKYSGVRYHGTTSVGIGHVGEAYVNFHESGVCGFFFVIGMALRAIDRAAGNAIRRGDVAAFIALVAASQSMLHVTGNSIEMFGGAVGGLCIALGLNWILRSPRKSPWTRRRPPPAPRAFPVEAT